MRNPSSAAWYRVTQLFTLEKMVGRCADQIDEVIFVWLHNGHPNEYFVSHNFQAHDLVLLTTNAMM